VNKDSNNKFSEELVNGSEEDDKDLIDINDEADDEVDENVGIEEVSLL
jgi:hypothetical protein